MVAGGRRRRQALSARWSRYILHVWLVRVPPFRLILFSSLGSFLLHVVTVFFSRLTRLRMVALYQLLGLSSIIYRSAVVVPQRATVSLRALHAVGLPCCAVLPCVLRFGCVTALPRSFLLRSIPPLFSISVMPQQSSGLTTRPTGGASLLVSAFSAFPLPHAWCFSISQWRACMLCIGTLFVIRGCSEVLVIHMLNKM